MAHTNPTKATAENRLAGEDAVGLPMQRDGGELRALALALGTIVALLPIIGLAWYVMWQAQGRLTPNPEAELMAELVALGPPGPMLDREYWEYGRKVFMATCISCHGPDGRGIAGNGKELVHSAFVRDKSDDALVEFIKKGRDLSDPLNTTRILMPPKGGNPAMSEDDMYDVVEYLRGLQDPRRIPPPGTPPASTYQPQAGASITASEGSALQ